MMPTGPMTPERYIMEREQEAERQKPRPNRVRLRTFAFSTLVRPDAASAWVPGKTNTMFFIHAEVADLFAGMFKGARRKPD